MFKHIPEILDECNKDVSLLQGYKNNAGLKFIFEYAFIPEKKLEHLLTKKMLLQLV